MRINTNVTAMNTLRQLSRSSSEFARSVGRLSSGLRINRAADDAAGLGVANRLAANIRGLQQASRNAEQANSLLQVAEGATQQVESILERMKELAVQSGSDNVNDSDRALIQDEFSELQEELDRIVDTTKFQGSTLLDGSFGTTFTQDTSGTSDFNDETTVSGVTVDVSEATGAQTLTVSLGDTDDGDNANSLNLDDGNGNVQQIAFDVSGGGEQTLNFDQFGVTITLDGSNSSLESDLNGALATDGNDQLVIQEDSSAGEFLVSDSGDPTGDDIVSIDALDLQSTTLAVDSGNISVDTKSNAQSAITAIDSAIGDVSEAFGSIGAAQNRLEFARLNTETAIENFSGAESVIRDVDMAAEVTRLTKFQILEQAGTAMLAQANSAPQSVLQLLG